MIGSPSYRSKNSIINSVYHYIIHSKLLKNYDVKTAYILQQAIRSDALRSPSVHSLPFDVRAIYRLLTENYESPHKPPVNNDPFETVKTAKSGQIRGKTGRWNGALLCDVITSPSPTQLAKCSKIKLAWRI
ncbi:hypothetical protein AVEN_82903-1 [Araneus ventricosus]|uniref:Uncharacterized protein n=1 Tax=Araneus ventricosus TaxID=182803 RepID=A0A4Y2VI94_ARAVE|nr:hypothetical protein AVEN_252111-1 [Araneus ventricosus]GBO24277.1 hypothetical protein AVEN_82903-1 [Araneus ventricosus]